MQILNKKQIRKLFGIIMALVLVIQTFTITGGSTVLANSDTCAYNEKYIPWQIEEALGKVASVPVYFEGKKVETFTKYIRKYDGKGIDIGGVATFRVSAYAYQSHQWTQAFKVGTLIEFLNSDKRWEVCSWHTKEEALSYSGVQNYVKKGVYIDHDGKAKELAVRIDDIKFDNPSKERDNLKVRFHLDIAGHKLQGPAIDDTDNPEYNKYTQYPSGRRGRITTKNVQFMYPLEWDEETVKPDGTESRIDVDRIVKPVEGEKNIWEVEVKVEGKAQEVNAPTDVVLVLDRSGSMRDWTGQIGLRRGFIVKDAMLDMIDSLLEEQNVNISIVSFGGFKNWQDGVGMPSQGFQCYDENWNEIYTKLSPNTKDIYWPQYTMDAYFTTDRSELKEAVVKTMDATNFHGATPVSLGLIKAAKMLQSRTADNKAIILVSDGMPAVSRDGKTEIVLEDLKEDKPETWDKRAMQDTLNVSNELHHKIEGLHLFTVATGDKISKVGKELLAACATPGEGYSHAAGDTKEALDAVMDKIATVIKSNIGSQTVLQEVLNDNVFIKSPTENMLDSVTTFTEAEDINWDETSVAISQGSIENLDAKQIDWSVGEITSNKPAIIRYRIELESGIIGQDYNVSKEANIQFVNNKNEVIEKEIPNAQIQLQWAKIKMSTGYNGTNTIVPNSKVDVWYKVPDGFAPGSMMFGYETKYDEASSEVRGNGAKTIRDTVVLPQVSDLSKKQIEKVKVNDEMKEVEDMDNNKISILKSPTTITTLLKMMEEINVSRKVTEVVDEKNVWEVELKVEGEGAQRNTTTDVVLVLDRSGSMATKVDGDIKRGDNIRAAAKDLVDTLLEEDNINVAAVSFGGFKEYPLGNVGPNDPSGNDGYIPAKGLQYYDENWNPKYFSKADKYAWDKENPRHDGKHLWAQYTVDSEFTTDPEQVKKGIDEGLYWRNLDGGTPIALGIIQAGRMLQESSGENKVMILLSDGAPSYYRDGRGTGYVDEENVAQWDKGIVEDTINASKQAHEKINNLQLFTIAAGNTIKEEGKKVLAACATNADEYVYTADDTKAAIEGVMSKIGSTVINKVETSTEIREELIPELKIESPAEIVSESIKTVEFTDETNVDTKPIEWDKTSLAITQGAIEESQKDGFTWNVGNVEYNKPAILKYRVHMKSGTIGKEYQISEGSTMEYVSLDNKTINKDIPNSSIDLSWVEMNLSTYDFKKSQNVPGSELTLWSKVPDGFTPGSMKFNYNLKYNDSSLEIDDSGDKTVESSVKLPVNEDGNPAVVLGVLVDENMFTEDQMTGIDGAEGADLIKTPTKVTSMVNEPQISSESNADMNFIQPEGITNISANLKFREKSKDVSYIVDTTNIVEGKLNGNVFMSYELSKPKIEVRKVNEGNRLLNPKVGESTTYDYEVIQSGNNIEIKFTGIVNEGDEFKMDVYIPTKFTQDAVYGGSTGATYLNTYKGKTAKVDTTIITTPKVEDITLDDGTIKEVYAYPIEISSKIKPENKITLTYLDLAGIH